MPSPKDAKNTVNLSAEDASFILSQTDARPMYQQILEQVQQRVAIGDWPAGTGLPSIRELAVALNVSVITVKRAYLELERNGVIVTQQGKGSWIGEGVDSRDLLDDELAKQIERVADLASALGLTHTELVARLQQYTGDSS